MRIQRMSEIFCLCLVFSARSSHAEIFAKAALVGADATEVTITLSPNAVGDLHVILEVTDVGQLPLTTYRRIIPKVN